MQVWRSVGEGGDASRAVSLLFPPGTRPRLLFLNSASCFIQEKSNTQLNLVIHLALICSVARRIVS